MADIFLSYSREDRPRAEKIALALKDAGYSVWWDRDITPRKNWDSVIDHEIREARAVLVLWSQRAVSPNSFVRKEAIWAERQGKLIPVFVEDCELPIAVHTVQTANLISWDGSADDREWLTVVSWIESLVAGHGGAPASPGAATVAENASLSREALVEEPGAALGQLESQAAPLDEPTGERGRTIFIGGVAGMIVLAVVGAVTVVLRSGPSDAPGVDARTLAASDRAPVRDGDDPLALYAAFRDCKDCPEMVVTPAADGASAGVAIGRFEVTTTEWNACVRGGGCSDAETYPDSREPVRNVTLPDALGYAAWLSETTGESYRLPTGEEWERAARGGTDGAYWFGGAFDAEMVVVGDGVEPVGARPANPYGLYEVTGNVAEWVAECHRENARGVCLVGRQRGGAFRSEPDALAIAQPLFRSARQRFDDTGLRVARDLADAPPS